MSSTPFTSPYWHPAVAADCVVFGLEDSILKVLLIKRERNPFKDQWAFPGGFLRKSDRTIEHCAARELREETGLELSYLEQFHVFSDAKRDPRERVVSVAFEALVRASEVNGGDDACEAQWFALEQLPRPLAFDHDIILEAALNNLRERIHFEPIGFYLLPEKFTMPQLQNLYEAILGIQFDRRNFHKKMLATGILIDLGDRKSVV